ncbi:MAG: hypothetical protein RIS76_960, partial [Verrucomicrobiota bacterium]
MNIFAPRMGCRMPLLSRLALVGLLGAATAQAAVFETVNFDTFGGNPALTIPDWDVFGISDVRTVTSSISNLAKVEVGLTLSGGFNGDLYVYLRHGDGFSVLLNRPGRSTSLPFGYEDAGVSVTFADDAAGASFHTYQDTTIPPLSASITGIWKPDGLEVMPLGSPSLYDTATPTALLSSFVGLDPNGVWTLYAADLSGGVSHQIESWSLTFFEAVTEVNAAPELAVVPNQTVYELSLLSFNLSATDADRPAQTLTYMLVSGPGGLSVSTAG